MTRGRRIALGLTVSALVLLLLEGLASWLVFAWEARLHVFWPIPDRAHTAYDPELGWVGERSHFAQDVFGPGLHVTTNALGLRGLRDYAREVPAGKTRLIALGDSFTLGYGVGDADSWPAQLEHACPTVEAPNMGQSGYGVDQDYLWYAREGGALEHSVLVLALIGDDLNRARSTSLLGYGKPVLRLEGGQLATHNVPVPRAAFLAPFLTQNLRLLGNLRMVELANKLRERFGPPPVDPWPIDDDAARELDVAIVAALDRAAAENGAKLVFVRLPHLSGNDESRLEPLAEWQAATLAEVASSGIPVADLGPEFEALPDAERRTLFQLHGMKGAGGHYSPAGNAFAARAIAARLAALGLIPAGACAS